MYFKLFFDWNWPGVSMGHVVLIKKGGFVMFNKTIILAVALLFIQPIFVSAGTVEVPKTGQTTNTTKVMTVI